MDDRADDIMKCIVCGEISRFTMFRGLSEEFKLCAEHYDTWEPILSSEGFTPMIIAIGYGLPFPQGRFELE